jgi:hypothetical protein
VLKLVYGCLAFSLIAGVFIFVSAASDGPGFYGMTKSMNDAIVQDGAVLAADRNGAITQTGNGRITGYGRDLKQLWSTTFDPFEEGPNNPYGAGTIKAFAWCTMGCPNAILDINREFTDRGNAGAGLAATLTSLDLDDDSVLAVDGLNAALVVPPSKTDTPPALRAILDTKSSEIPIANPTTVAINARQPSSNAIVGSARGRSGYLTRMTWEDGKSWEIHSPRIREIDLKNACISADGGSIGLVNNRVKQANFFGAPGAALGPEISSGTCTVDANGITAAYTPATNPGSLEAARYAADGKRVWHHTFGAQRLLSKSGWRLLVAQSRQNVVTAIDAITGRTVFEQPAGAKPFAAQDGSIVTAGRDGKPHWLLVGKPPTN